MGVAHTDDFDGSKYGGEGARAQSAMGVEHMVWKVQRRSHISVATILQVGWEEEALHLAAFGLLFVRAGEKRSHFSR
jgi:hypothetical protein